MENLFLNRSLPWHVIVRDTALTALCLPWNINQYPRKYQYDNFPYFPEKNNES